MFSTSTRHRHAFGLLAALLALLFIGCERQSSPIVAVATEKDANKIRIVCLSPALTQMLNDLGFSEQIVGVGEIDPVAPKQARIVGHFRQIEYEKLLSVQPTHLFMQDTQKEPISDKLKAMATEQKWVMARFRLETAGDVLRVVHELGEALAVKEAAAALAQQIKSQMKTVTELSSKQTPLPSLLVVGSGGQWMAAGPGTFLDEVLTAAGGVNVLPASAVLYPELDAERVLALRPAVVVHIRGEGGARSLVLPTALKARLVEMDDPAALLPSSSMPRIAARLAVELFPELADPLQPILVGTSHAR